MISPAKLNKGDEVRIIAPSRSLKILSDDGVLLAKKRLEELGLKVTFGKNIKECDMQRSSPISQRVEDLHNAFADSNVKGILTVIGGFNCNELLILFSTFIFNIPYYCLHCSLKMWCMIVFGLNLDPSFQQI